MPWDLVPDSQILAVHAALLPTGQVLYFGGDQHYAGGLTSGAIDNTRLFNPTGNAITPVTFPAGSATDIFCSSHAYLPDGRLLVGGGTAQWGTGGDPNHPHGLNFGGERGCWLFEPRAGRWRRVADLNVEPGQPDGGGRWYPTLLALANGDVIAFSGHPHRDDSRHNNDTPERYSPGSNVWSLLSATSVYVAFYPRVHLLRDGRIFLATPLDGANRIYDPNAPALDPLTITAPTDPIYQAWDGTSVLLPLLPGDGYTERVLLADGVTPRRLNVRSAAPTWQATAPRTGAAAGRLRQYGCAVLLPTGQVFVTGGVQAVSPEQGVLEGELYTPGIDWATNTYVDETGGTADAWTSTDAATVVRNYHSVAVLLPNGRVWTAGSNHNAATGNPSDANIAEKRIEIFRPAYDGDPARPTITAAPPVVTYGQAFTVRTPEAANIRRVAIIRCGSVTHAFDGDQRYVGLLFTYDGGDQLTVTAPPSAGIAPGGYHTLWVIDAAGRPCQLASFLRVTAIACQVVTDRSTFSILEVQALLDANPTATFPDALYLLVDGFLPHELGTPPPTPTFEFRFDGPAGPVVGSLSALVGAPLYEDPSLPADVAQRVTFPVTLRFADASAYATFTEFRTLHVRATLGAHTCAATLVLTKQPNPYMLDGPVSWLSTDVRVFQIREGESRAGVTHGTGASAPNTFISQLLAAFNGVGFSPGHPFLGISTDQASSALQLSHEVAGQRIYNYAVAMVRYRAAVVTADNVRVFFRAFNTVGTALEYDPATTYRRAGTAPNVVPLLGRQGSAITSIPFFAEPRVDATAASMTTQLDPLNRRTLAPMGANESVGFFGCWLDFNQTTPRFPLNPTPGDDGPFPASGLLSIQQLVRGRHQCLVAEVFFEADPIPAGATPGSSDNLSQRNLAIEESANPGNALTRTVQHSFELKPSRGALGGWERPVAQQALTLVDEGRSRSPSDELLIRWRNLPRDAEVTLYFPDVDLDAVLRAAAARGGPPRYERVDQYTVRCLVGDISFLPIPGGRTVNIPGLLTVALPAGITKGEVFSISLQQYSGVTRQILGSFQLTIPVRTESLIAPAAARALSLMGYIAESIPPTDQWFPIFVRHLDFLRARVAALGGDPAQIEPSPNGDGSRPPEVDMSGRCTCPRDYWVVPLLVAALTLSLALVPLQAAAAVGVVGLLLVFVSAWWWWWRCTVRRCELIIALLLGLAIGGALVGLLLLAGLVSTQAVAVLVATVLVVGILALAAALGGCWGACWSFFRDQRDARVGVGPEVRRAAEQVRARAHLPLVHRLPRRTPSAPDDAMPARPVPPDHTDRPEGRAT